MSRARIVHVTTTDMSLALLLGPQLAAFKADGYDVIGCSAPGPYVPQLKELGVRHVPLRHATRSMAPWQDIAACNELVRVFERLRPDIVHTHNPKPVVYGLERIASKCSHAELVQNIEDLPVLHKLGVPSDRLHLLGNGIDLGRFDAASVDPAVRKRLRLEWSIADDDVVIGVVGRLVW